MLPAGLLPLTRGERDAPVDINTREDEGDVEITLDILRRMGFDGIVEDLEHHNYSARRSLMSVIYDFGWLAVGVDRSEARAELDRLNAKYCD